MINLEQCNTLNDIARLIFNKANYTNREKCKKILAENGINWETWLAEKKVKPKRYCLYCGKEITDGGLEKKFCNHSCSASYNNSKRTIVTKTKTSDTLFKRYNGEIEQKPKRYCLYCGNELNPHQSTFCSKECQNKKLQNDYITRWKNGEENGLKGEYQISNHIRRYFMDKYQCKCQICGWGEINEYSKTIPLELHHLDGNYLNNTEENLQLLCPNCHSLTETYKSHNKNGRKGREKYN